MLLFAIVLLVLVVIRFLPEPLQPMTFIELTEEHMKLLNHGASIFIEPKQNIMISPPRR